MKSKTFLTIFASLYLAAVLTLLTTDNWQLLAQESERAKVRIKDLAQVRGVRDNQLVGYGLVVGLDKTGDSNRSLTTVQSVINMLSKFGITVPQSQVSVNNIASVMVTATLPAFTRSGSRIDVTVSAVGDAKNLQGGILIQSPLFAPASEEPYAMAAGAVSIGGIVTSGGGRGAQRNHATVGRIPGGAIVEREVAMNFIENGSIHLVLHQPDFTTAFRISQAINQTLKDVPFAQAIDAGSVRVQIPDPDFTGREIEFISLIGTLTVEPDAPARVVVNERTGTVVIGEGVKVSAVAVSHGSLSVSISTPDGAPSTSTGGRTPSGRTAASEGPKVMLMDGANIGDLVKALNAIGATPRDIIAILQAVEKAGALHGKLEIM